MNEAEVLALIREQVGDRWGATDWPHGVVLDDCVLDPPRRETFHVAWDADLQLDLWLVLDEPEDGYCIAFDPESREFGLATRIELGPLRGEMQTGPLRGEMQPGLLLLGFYGDFVETLEGM